MDYFKEENIKKIENNVLKKIMNTNIDKKINNYPIFWINYR